ncbi:MAG TPA: DUF2231 domain-containing protein, partial [Bacteroidales bacterium]|nr:DUF2231 domain-containing protein [Bacteroidales bacterium]
MSYLSYLELFDVSHIHPMVTHFPIAIIMVGFLADLVSLFFKKEKCLSRMGYYLAILGMLAAIAAWGTGYFLTSTMEGEAGDLRATHKLFATLTLITIIVATSFRSIIVYVKRDESNLKYVSIGLFFLAFLFVGYTGYLG